MIPALLAGLLFGATLSPTPVSLCDLLLDPEPFYGKLVEVSALEEGGYHGSWFYDPSCPTMDATLDLGNALPTYTESDPCRELSYPNGMNAQPRFTRIVGVLQAWNGVGYCAFEECRFEIRPQCVFPPDKPHEPRENSLESGTFMDEVAALKTLGNRAAFAIAFGDRAEVRATTTSTFQLIDEDGNESSRKRPSWSFTPLCNSPKEVGIRSLAYPTAAGATGRHHIECHDATRAIASRFECVSTYARSDREWKVQSMHCVQSNHG